MIAKSLLVVALIGSAIAIILPVTVAITTFFFVFMFPGVFANRFYKIPTILFCNVRTAGESGCQDC